MTRLEEYKLRKHIEKLNTNMWVVKSTRKGVELPICVPVYEVSKISNCIEYGDDGERHFLNIRYKLKTDNFPYEVEIEENKTSDKEIGTGTGFGDLWEWTNFFSLSEQEAKEYYEEELKRVTETYLTPKPTYDDLVETIASIAYLYKDKRLNTTNFFNQGKTDLEHLLGILKKAGYKYKEGESLFFNLEPLIDKLDADGCLSEEFL